MKALELSLIAVAVLITGAVMAVQFAPSLASKPFRTASSASEQTQQATDLSGLLSRGNRGSVAAQFQLGLMYDSGEGVPQQDYAEAAKWYRKAAERGFAPAQFNLGLLYTLGRGAPSQGIAEAVKWWRLSAEQGHSEAQLSLGLMYLWGQGVPRDCKAADKWLNLAALKGSTLAMKMHNVIAGKVHPTKVAPAQRMASAQDH